MADEFKDQVVEKPAESRGTFARAPIVETMEENEIVGQRNAAGEDISDKAAGRELPSSVLDKIDALAKDRGVAIDDDAPDEEPPSEETKPPEEAAPETPTEAPKPETPAAPSEDKLRADRLEAANVKLAADLEVERARPRGTTGFVAKTDYLDDSTTALREYIAHTLGIADPKAKEVDAELALLYTDLTAKELGVPVEEAQQAKRDAARTRQILAREKREREASKQTTEADAKADLEAKTAAHAASIIGNRLQTKREDGTAIAESFPLLMALSQDLDGMKPESLLWKVVEREIKMGRFDPGTPNEQLIDAAAKLVETHYQAVVAKATKATTPKVSPPSTAPKPNDATASASKETRQQSHGARTLTNADASVAPSTPPAPKKPAAKKEPPPKFKSDSERKDWALRHLSK
jgi:hypothetical protein